MLQAVDSGLQECEKTLYLAGMRRGPAGGWACGRQSPSWRCPGASVHGAGCRCGRPGSGRLQHVLVGELSVIEVHGMVKVVPLLSCSSAVVLERWKADEQVGALFLSPAWCPSGKPCVLLPGCCALP